MEKLKLKLNKKQLVLALFIAGAVLILFDIIMLAVVVPQGRPGFFKIMLALIFGLMTLLGVWLLLAAYVHSHDADSHFFRYDEETRRNIPTKELTGERVIRRMSLYLRNMVGKDDYLPEVWERNYFRETDKEFGENRVLAPLVAYKMLYDLASVDQDDCWKLFVQADASLIYDISDELRRAGEQRMPQALEEIYSDAEGKYIENIKDFLVGNKRYMKRRMLEYALKNDVAFY